MNTLVSLPIAAAVPTAAPATPPLPSSDDPILTAIDIHRAALANHLSAIEAEEKLSCDKHLYDTRYWNACRATQEASSAADSTAMRFLDIKPTTVAGAAALLNYVSAAERQTFPEFDNDGKRISFENEIMRHVSQALDAPTTRRASARQTSAGFLAEATVVRAADCGN